jgi:hypothetical protein
LVHNQNFEKQKKWNSKIPEPHPLLLESMKYVKKSGHGEEWVNAEIKFLLFKEQRPFKLKKRISIRTMANHKLSIDTTQDPC